MNNFDLLSLLPLSWMEFYIFPWSRSEPVGPFSDLSAEGFRSVTVALVFIGHCLLFGVHIKILQNQNELHHKPMYADMYGNITCVSKRNDNFNTKLGIFKTLPAGAVIGIYPLGIYELMNM